MPRLRCALALTVPMLIAFNAPAEGFSRSAGAGPTESGSYGHGLSRPGGAFLHRRKAPRSRDGVATRSRRSVPLALVGGRRAHRRPPFDRAFVVPPELIQVHDGDTFHAGWLTIRLHGIDTPELGEPKAADATRRLAELLRAGPVTIVPRAEDVYHRLVADVFVRGENVAEVLRREGFEKPRLRL